MSQYANSAFITMKELPIGPQPPDTVIMLEFLQIAHYEVIDEKPRLIVLASQVLADESHGKILEIFLTIPCVRTFKLVLAKYQREGRKLWFAISKCIKQESPVDHSYRTAVLNRGS